MTVRFVKRQKTAMIGLALRRDEREAICAPSLDAPDRGMFVFTTQYLRHCGSFHVIPVKTLKHKTEENDTSKFIKLIRIKSSGTFENAFGLAQTGIFLYIGTIRTGGRYFLY
jgi:hypothetical protein